MKIYFHEHKVEAHGGTILVLKEPKELYFKLYYTPGSIFIHNTVSPF